MKTKTTPTYTVLIDACDPVNYETPEEVVTLYSLADNTGDRETDMSVKNFHSLSEKRRAPLIALLTDYRREQYK